MLRCEKGRLEVPKTCPACGEKVSLYRYVYERDGLVSHIGSCEACSMMFATPSMIPELSERQMETVNDAELFNDSLLKRLHRRFVIGREVGRVKKLLGRESFSLLDIGCGTGWTTRSWVEEGAIATGLEPSRPRAEIARSRHGLRVVEGYVEELSAEERFDVVAMRHVLEHFEQPSEVLSRVRSVLNPGGVLLVIVPNIDTLGRHLFGCNWTWVLPWHCNFFTPRSLRAILRRAGYEVVQLYQAPSPLWYPESFLRSLPIRNETLRTWLIGRPSLLAMLPFAPLVALGILLGRSENLTVLARPTGVAPS